MTTRGPYVRRTNRIADMLMKRHPEFSREFAVSCTKAAWISDVTDFCLMREAEWKAQFLRSNELC
jgi:hypothetical protein